MASKMQNWYEYQRRHLSPADFAAWVAGDVKVQSWLDRQNRIPAKIRALEKAQGEVLKKVIGPALEDAGKQLAAEEKADAPNDSGTLRQAIGSTKARLYPATFCGYVASGVRRGYARAVEIDVKQLSKGKIRLKRLGKKASLAGPKSKLKNPAEYARYLRRGRRAMLAAQYGKKALLIRAQGFVGLRAKVAAAAPEDFMQHAADDRPEIAAAAGRRMARDLKQLVENS